MVHFPERVLILEFDSFLAKLIVNDLKVTNFAPEFFTSECNSFYINIILANNASIDSHFLCGLKVISGYNPNSDSFWCLWLWLLNTILKQVNSFFNILAKWVNQPKSSKINKITFKNVTILW